MIKKAHGLPGASIDSDHILLVAEINLVKK